MGNKKSDIQFLKIIRLTSRILSFFLLVLFIAFAFGEGLPFINEVTSHETLLFIAVFIMLVGVIIAFKYELVGGSFMILAYVFFSIVSKQLIAGPIFPLFLLIGLLYIYYWWKTKRESNN